MSRILEALRQARLVNGGQERSQPPVMNAPEVPDRRRSPRWTIDVCVYVYGHGPGKEPFHEEAHTLHVNANGGLLLLSAPVRKGQRLLLTNRLTEQDQACCVVYLGTKHSRTIEAGVVFPETNPGFWRVTSSPDAEPAA